MLPNKFLRLAHCFQENVNLPGNRSNSPKLEYSFQQTHSLQLAISFSRVKSNWCINYEGFLLLSKEGFALPLHPIYNFVKTKQIYER